MKNVLTLINLFLIGASAFFCSDMVYKTILADTSFVPEIEDQSSKPINSIQKQEKKDTVRQGPEIIVQRNIFKVETEKKEGSDKASGSKEKEKIEPTTLSLTLWGTVTGGSDLYAVIEDKKSRIQSLYQEGDSVQDATIKKIMKKEVILNFQGKDQVLEMETNPETAGQGTNPLNKPAPRGAINENQNGLPPVAQPRQTSVQPGNAGEIATKIKFRPFFTKGSPDGVMVYAIKPDSVFNKAGIRNGDIVKSINGAPVSSVEDASSLLSGMENAETAKLTLIRSGETKEITYSAGSTGGAAQPGEEPAHVVPEQMKEEKLPDPTQNKGEIKAQAPEEQEPEKTENSEDQNKGEE